METVTLKSGKQVDALTQEEWETLHERGKAHTDHPDRTPRCCHCGMYTYGADCQLLEGEAGRYSDTGSYVRFRYCPQCEPINHQRELAVFP